MLTCSMHSGLTQDTLKSFTENSGFWAGDQHKCCADSVCNTFIATSTPLSLLDHPDFRDMMHTVAPKFKIPGIHFIVLLKILLKTISSVTSVVLCSAGIVNKC